MPPDSVGFYEMEKIQNIDNQLNKIAQPHAPGKIPSFWWSFVISAIGAYTLYGLAVGPISVLVVFFASKRNKTEVNKSLWGWIAGTLVGIGLFIVLKLL